MALKRKAVTRDSPVADEVLLSDGGEDIDIGPLNALLSSDEEGEEHDSADEVFDSDSGSGEGDEADDFEIESDATETGSNVTTPEDDKPNYRITTDANGNPRYVYDEIDPIYDSDDSEAPETTNTIGNIPLSFYDAYPHIGYDINGRKISRPAKGEALDQLLDSIDIPKGWTGLTDPATGQPLKLSQEELELLKRIQLGEAPQEGYDPYPEMVEWFTGKEEIMPLSSAPEPKRRFVPSKHEQKRVMKLVKAIREGRIQPYRAPQEREEEEADPEIIKYDIWADEAPRPDHIMNIPAPKLAPPGFEESYNPPAEYLPDEQERKEWEEADEEDRDRKFLPTGHDALRKVPGYDGFVKENFERCLDLYLAPRVRRNKLNIDPESLLPKLPSPEELRPFPSACSVTFRGHKGRVRSVAVDPTGFWAATGGDDGTVRVWDITIGRQVWHVKLDSDDAVNAVQWRPGRDGFILAAACGDDLYLIIPPLCSPEVEAASRALLDVGWGYATAANGASSSKAAGWARPGAKLENSGVLVRAPLRQTVKHVSWHRRGEYLVTVAPDGQSGAVAILTLSKHLTQFPFRKPKGKAQAAHFHPSRPILFVATQKAIRSWDLSKSTQLKKIIPGATWISGFSVHPGGDNLLVSSYDKRLLWHDLELSNYPHKTLRYHSQAIRAVGFHKSFPLFADASDDGTLQVFHGRVANDAMENATIVPLKMLRGHKVVQRLGVLALEWMTTQPWLLSAGADGTAKLWT